MLILNFFRIPVGLNSFKLYLEENDELKENYFNVSLVKELLNLEVVLTWKTLPQSQNKNKQKTQQQPKKAPMLPNVESVIIGLSCKHPVVCKYFTNSCAGSWFVCGTAPHFSLMREFKQKCIMVC